MKILLIDDDPDVRKIIERCLVSVGRFETVVAENAPSGLLLARSEQPDLIVMDMMMPGMDGLEALAVLKSSPGISHIPVVFMTAKVQRTEVEHYLKVGAIGVLKKPFDPMKLPDEIRTIMDARKG